MSTMTRDQRTKAGIIMIGVLMLFGCVISIGTLLWGNVSHDAMFVGGCLFVHLFWSSWSQGKDLR